MGVISYVRQVRNNYRARRLAEELGWGILRWADEDIDTVVVVTARRDAGGYIHLYATRDIRERIEELDTYTTESGSTEARAWVPLADLMALLEGRP